MSETPIAISALNDFIFCPVSIYFHKLAQQEDDMLLKGERQLNGTNAHKNSDAATYSSKKSMLQGMSVYCSEYDLYGCIDTFDSESGILTERKRKVRAVYDGFVFQLYAQCFALREMGYTVGKTRLYSMLDNKSYDIPLPEDNPDMLIKFKNLVEDIRTFSMQGFIQSNSSKCNSCIYEPLCSFSVKTSGG